jgi:hypothetical protein
MLGAACAGPHSTGALWAQQNLDQERAMFQLSDAQRSGIAEAYELRLADETLRAERQRITTELQTCPGTRQVLSVSPGDAVRDTVRLQAQSDPARLAEVTELALADWYVRRSGATGNATFCERARSALDGNPAPDAGGNRAPDAAGDLLSDMPPATVTRDPGSPTPALTSDPPMLTLSEYALGSVDSVYAAAPLPQYLALVYGGFLQLQLQLQLQPEVQAAGAAVADAETAADLVDRQAPAYPDWEPDALYAALRGGQS